MKNTTIDFTQAIRSGKLSFEQAIQLQGKSITEAIREEILTFEQALDIQGIAAETSLPEKPEKPKAPKAPKAPEPKAEVQPEEPEEKGFSYTKGGAVIQYAGHNTLKANNLRRVNNAVEKLVKAGFCVSWKRIGGWIWLNHSKKADGKTVAEFKAAVKLLAKGWEVHGNSIVDKNMLENYEDNFMQA